MAFGDAPQIVFAERRGIILDFKGGFAGNGMHADHALMVRDRASGLL